MNIAKTCIKLDRKESMKLSDPKLMKLEANNLIGVLSSIRFRINTVRKYQSLSFTTNKEAKKGIVNTIDTLYPNIILA
jgi:hypothetical protein